MRLPHSDLCFGQRGEPGCFSVEDRRSSCGKNDCKREYVELLMYNGSKQPNNEAARCTGQCQSEHGEPYDTERAQRQ